MCSYIGRGPADHLHQYPERPQNNLSLQRRKSSPRKTEYDDGTTKEFAYDQWGNKILEKSRDGSENRWTYRQDGKLLRQELPGGLIWEYEYDERGNLVHWWNNDGEEFFAQFDAHNNCVREEQVIDAVRRPGADLSV